MNATPASEFLVTREAGFYCGEDLEQGKSSEGREITSLRDWVVVATNHEEAIHLAGGPTLLPGEGKHEVREEDDCYVCWEAFTLKELAEREGDTPTARMIFNKAKTNPGREILESDHT